MNTKRDLHNEIVDVRYWRVPITTCTVCCIVLASGFTVIGKSACSYFTEFDERKGRELAREDAERKLREFQGFVTSDELHAECKAKARAEVDSEAESKWLAAFKRFNESVNTNPFARPWALPIGRDSIARVWL